MSHKKNLFPTLPPNFNRRETLKKEATRMSNIRKPLPHRISNISNMNYAGSQNKNIDNENALQDVSFKPGLLLKETPQIYSFSPNGYKNSICLMLQRENQDHLIPKITHREITIPVYSNKDNFDLEHISESISQTMKMKLLQPEPISEDTKDIDTNIELLKKKGIRKIYHVYQEKYSNDVFPTGLGDFIRSCFFIIQFATKYGFDYEIIIHHPITRFLHKYSGYPVFMYDSYPISMFVENNWLKNTFDTENHMTGFELKTDRMNDFVAYLTKLPAIQNSIFSYNIFFPIQEISHSEKYFLRDLFQPSREMDKYFNQTLKELGINKDNYMVVHIRSGDPYLTNETKAFDNGYLNTVKKNIGVVMLYARASGADILLIADNNEIKYLLKQTFPVIKCVFKPITHVGEGVKLEYEKIQNTMADFYVMSYSRFIYSFTCYSHGSGFSYWCSVIYDIPYKCKYIKND